MHVLLPVVQSALDFLNRNSGAFTLVFTAAVAVSTIVYAILTARLVSETRTMRRAQTEPRVSVTIQPREEWLNFWDIVIRNIGLAPAYDVRFKVKPDFEYEDGKFLSHLSFLRNGLKYLEPGQTLSSFLASSADRWTQMAGQPFDIHVSYLDAAKVRHQDVFTVDFSAFADLAQLGTPPLYTIAKSIERMERCLDGLASGSYKPKIVTYTPKDIAAERRRTLRRLRQHGREGKGHDAS